MCIDGMQMADRAVNVLIPARSQWPEFYDWAHHAFDLTDDSWDPAGEGDPGNGNLPYGKMINSIFLLAYALRDNHDASWHSAQEYLSAGLALDSPYHDEFEFLFVDGSGEATADGDETEMHCAVFNLDSVSNDPANRASVLAHEGWHHWQDRYDWESGHLTGGAIEAGLEGDWYYRHGFGAFEFGELWKIDLGSAPIKFHSPYQIAVEFDADLTEQSQPWVPEVVRQSARYFGNRRLESQFKNRVSYRIGDPRPF